MPLTELQGLKLLPMSMMLVLLEESGIEVASVPEP